MIWHSILTKSWNLLEDLENFLKTSWNLINLTKFDSKEVLVEFQRNVLFCFSLSPRNRHMLPRRMHNYNFKFLSITTILSDLDSEASRNNRRANFKLKLLIEADLLSISNQNSFNTVAAFCHSATNFRLGSNRFQLEYRFGTHGNWKNQTPVGCFGDTS